MLKHPIGSDEGERRRKESKEINRSGRYQGREGKRKKARK